MQYAVAATLTLSPRLAIAETVDLGRVTLSASNLFELCSVNESDTIIEGLQQRQEKCVYYVKGVKDAITETFSKPSCDGYKLELIYRRLVSELTSRKDPSALFGVLADSQVPAANLLKTYLLGRCRHRGA